MMKHASYGWIITTDHAPDTSAPEGSNANAKGVTGPHNISPAIEARLKAGEGRPFQMRDDDGELYYTGRIITRPEDEQGVKDFAPLDDFGKPNAGASEIWYWINGKWTEL
jgi:hypothetical protein